MKITFSKSLLLILCLVTLVISCKKEKANTPPTANAGADQTITLPRDTITLFGSGSDINGSITGYLWTQVSGPATATIANNGFSSVLLNNLKEGSYVFQLTVYDNDGISGNDLVSVVVEPAVIVPNTPPTANAGADQTIKLPRDTITLFGSGSDIKGSITGYLWTQVSGPATATITNNGFSSVLLDNLKEGSYVFQLTVYDDGGMSGNDLVSVVVEPAATVTAEFFPSQNPDEIHLLGNNFGLDQSDPNAPEFGATAWTNGGIPTYMRGAFKFDLHEIPANAIISSAKLTLYSTHTPINGNQADANYGSDNSMFIQRITSNWNANSTGWANQPSVTASGQISIPSTSQRFLDLVDVDVTGLVAPMVNNNANYGFLIKLQNEVIYTSRIFCSSKYPDAARHPKLVVTYTRQ